MCLRVPQKHYAHCPGVEKNTRQICFFFLNTGNRKTTSSSQLCFMKICWTSTVRTRFQARGQLRSVGANGTKQYLNSFFPRTIRVLKIGHNQDHSLALRSQRRPDWSSCSVKTAQLLSIIWLLSNTCSNYYPYVAHPFSRVRFSVMITMSMSSKYKQKGLGPFSHL